jgi:hypothetical protein
MMLLNSSKNARLIFSRHRGARAHGGIGALDVIAGANESALLDN